MVKYAPGSVQWRNLLNASTYTALGVTLLRGKVVQKYVYDALMLRWASFEGDPKFRAALVAAGLK